MGKAYANPLVGGYKRRGRGCAEIERVCVKVRVLVGSLHT